MDIWQELGISGGNAILILIALYFIIKWAVKNGVKEAYEDITGNKTAENIKIEKMLDKSGSDKKVNHNFSFLKDIHMIKVGGKNMNDIILRVATIDDTKELLEIYKPYVENTAITFEYDVPSEEEFKRRIENTLNKYPYLVAERNGEIVGYAYASPFHERIAYQWAVEVTVYIRQDMQKLGIGKKLYLELEKFLKLQNILNLNACIAYPETEDEYLTKNSVNFHQHMGYSVVGEFHKCGFKFNRWYNMIWMEKHIGHHSENTPPIKTFKEIR